MEVPVSSASNQLVVQVGEDRVSMIADQTLPKQQVVRGPAGRGTVGELVGPKRPGYPILTTRLERRADPRWFPRAGTPGRPLETLRTALGDHDIANEDCYSRVVPRDLCRTNRRPNCKSPTTSYNFPFSSTLTNFLRGKVQQPDPVNIAPLSILKSPLRYRHHQKHHHPNSPFMFGDIFEFHAGVGFLRAHFHRF